MSQASKATQNRISKTGDVVMVGLKSPNGIVLQLQKEELVRYPKRDGGFHEIKEWHTDYEAPTYRLNGNRAPHGEAPKCLVIGGYAMTTIPKDFWEKWIEQNKNLDMVKNRMIFAHATEASARDQGQEQAKISSGQEPLRMEKGNMDPRIPKKKDTKTGKMVDAIEVGEKVESE